MIIEIHYNNCLLKLSEGEDNSVFQKLKQAIQYNVHIPLCKKKTGLDFDENNLEVLQAYLPHARATGFQNYICRCINMLTGEHPLNYNFVDRTTFNFHSDGWECPFKITKVSKKVKVRNGWVRTVAKWFVAEYGIDPEFVEKRDKENIQFKSPRDYSLKSFKDPRYNQVEAVDSLIDPFVGIDENGLFDPDRARMSRYLLTGVMLGEAVGSGKTNAAAIIYKNIVDCKAVFPFVKKLTFNQAVCDYMELGFDVSVICADKASLKQMLKSKGITREPKYDTFGDMLFVMCPTYYAGWKPKKGKTPKYDGTELEKYNVGFFDEAQELSQDSRAVALIESTKLMLKIGYTGTSNDSPDRRKRAAIVSWFGFPIHTRTIAENVLDGVVLKPEIHFYDHKPTMLLETGIADNYIYRNTQRMAIVDHVLNKYPDEQIFIYTGHLKLERGKFLYEYLNRNYDKVCYGDGTKEGNAIAALESFNKKESRIAVGNQVYRKGLNIPVIEVFINWESTDNEETVIQAAIGRSIRLNGEATTVIIIDFYDYVPQFLQKSKVREELYLSDRVNAIVKYFNENQEEYDKYEEIENQKA